MGASVQVLAVSAQGLHVELSRGWPRHMNFLVDPPHDLSDRARTLPRRHGPRGCGCELSVARRRAAGSTERGCAERRRQRERCEDAAVGEVEQPNAAAAAAACRRRGLRASTAQMGEFRSLQGEWQYSSQYSSSTAHPMPNPYPSGPPLLPLATNHPRGAGPQRRPPARATVRSRHTTERVQVRQIVRWDQCECVPPLRLRLQRSYVLRKHWRPSR